MASKRKRKELTLREKIEVIEFKKKDPKAAIRAIAEHFKCGRTQVNTVLTNQEKLLEQFAGNGNADSKRAREVRFPDIDSAVVEWYRKARRKNIPVTGPMLQEKACQVAVRMGLVDEFRAPNGWLEKFKIRYNIKGMTVCGESGELNEETVESWKERW